MIAVDVSNSMDPEEQALQREGYITGLTSRQFLSALRDGINGRIALTYFEWAGPLDQKIIMPWRLIDGPDTASAVAKEIGAAPYRRQEVVANARPPGTVVALHGRHHVDAVERCAAVKETIVRQTRNLYEAFCQVGRDDPSSHPSERAGILSP